MTPEEAIKTWLPIIAMGVENMPELKEALEMAIEALKDSRPTGCWTHDGSKWKERWICSECGVKLIDEQTNYCPNCGAKMKSGKGNCNG